MFFVYVLQSISSGKIYIGHTNNLERRLIEHNLRTKRYTSKKGPWKIIYSENFSTRAEAIRREKSLKGGQGRQFIKQFILAEQSA